MTDVLGLSDICTIERTQGDFSLNWSDCRVRNSPLPYARGLAPRMPQHLNPTS
jgi:hypothetical protein